MQAPDAQGRACVDAQIDEDDGEQGFKINANSTTCCENDVIDISVEDGQKKFSECCEHEVSIVVCAQVRVCVCERERERERETERQRETERETERQRQRQREKRLIELSVSLPICPTSDVVCF